MQVLGMIAYAQIFYPDDAPGIGGEIFGTSLPAHRERFRSSGSNPQALIILYRTCEVVA
jgi:hypothetical protein